jgi:hypothetical protein
MRTNIVAIAGDDQILAGCCLEAKLQSSILLVSRTAVMINRDSRGRQYSRT